MNGSKLHRGEGDEAPGIAELAVMIVVSLALVGSAAGAAMARKAWRTLVSRDRPVV